MSPLVLRFGGYQKTASIHNQAARRFGEALRRMLGHAVSFELVESVLDRGRKSGDLPVMVEEGGLSGCYMSTVRFSDIVPDFKVLELPFVVRDRATLFRALDGEIGEGLRRRMLENAPFRILGYWDNGYRHLTNRVRPIRAPRDCAGLRIRTQMSALHGEVFRALGFVPVAADIKEFVEGIGGDRFEAQDNPLTNIWNFGVHRHHRYITLTGHFFGGTLFICNKSRYQSWPPEVRAAVDEAAREATLLQRQLAAAEDAAILERLDPRENEVIHLTAAERAAFVEVVQPIVAKHRAETGTPLYSALTR